MKIKICGITNLADARIALEAGADYLGFIFYAPSPRSITVTNACRITEALRADYNDAVPYFVGVFVNETVSAVEEKLDEAGLDFAQLSGDESPQMLQALHYRAYKAIQPRSLAEALEDVKLYAPLGLHSAEHPAILVDAYHPNLRGGTGELADPELVGKIRDFAPRMMLAGGLTPENIGAVVRTVQPFAIDVASGVEASKGKKDHAKVREFITTARLAAAEVE